jgi:pilus assembly protein CpaE
VKLITVGLLEPSTQLSMVARSHVHGTGLGTVVVDSADYPRARSDAALRRFLDANPELIIVDAQDVSAAIEAIRVLHAALPAAWILVSTSVLDAQIILEMVRSGAREIIPNPATQANLTYALQHYIEERDRERKSNSGAHGKLYPVCEGKRGSGATTVALNLAASLAEIPNTRVALIDLDWPVGDAAAYLNIAPRFTLANALSSAVRLDSVLLDSYMHQHDRLYVLPSSETLESDEMLTEEAVAQLLDVVAQTYTHAVIDLPISLDRKLVRTVTTLSKTVLAVLTPELPSIRRTERLLRFFGEFEAADKIQLVLNRARKSDEIDPGQIEKALKHPVSWTVSNDYRACSEAINAGKTILAVSNKHISRDLREMARELAGYEIEDKRRGLLNLLPKTSSSF